MVPGVVNQTGALHDPSAPLTIICCQPRRHAIRGVAKRTGFKVGFVRFRAGAHVAETGRPEAPRPSKHMGVSESSGYLILGVLITRILLFRVLYSGPLLHSDIRSEASALSPALRGHSAAAYTTTWISAATQGPLIWAPYNDTYTILGVPYYHYSRMGPQTPILIIKVTDS